MKLSFVIPCYGSEKTIALVVKEIEETVKTRPEFAYEIILVNDCSKDNVWQVIDGLCAKNAHIKGVNLARNFGQQSALMAGYRRASGDFIISLDDDGQSPANRVFDLIDKALEGYDVVYAYYPQRKHSAFRNFGSKVDKMMEEALVDRPKGLKSSSYHVMRKFIVDEITRYPHAFTYIGGLVFRSTKNIASVPVEQRERLEGQSGYTLKKLLRLWTNGFTAFSVKPLRISTMVGVFSAFIGFCYAIFTIIRKIVHPHIQAGWSSLMAINLILGGLILLMIGLVGEYVGRMYLCINQAPQYVVRETRNITEASDNSENTGDEA